ncbi:hypothetical protein [Acidisphaera rubrifaciens]|uniref:Uncharacterized protein n=1 Tax=Acidisphaera rubrifaciens HS-AP3 TaxID=1231350 RepID=A0A0D6P9W9_9PROT|nr:hypothetical protein [Acidisphaera rubrifaciens]GAN78565.1 hypothetical protein Asru_1193_02 [Acidisphaera rubrifaciens HS-AP3]
MSQSGYPPDEEMASPHPAERLEAALERIARVATAEIIRAGRTHAPQVDAHGDAPGDEAGMAATPAAEIAARLDELILRLRAVLAETV